MPSSITPRARSTAFGSIVALFLSLGAAGFGADASPDPVLGKWRGTLRSGADQTDFGLELKLNEKNELAIEAYLPEAHMDGMSIGTLTREGNHYRSGGLNLELKGDQLEGQVGSVAVRAALRRSDTLPVVPLPEAAPAAPAPLWEHRASSAFWASPVVEGDAVYAVSADGVVHALAAADGQVRWTYAMQAPAYGAVLASGDRVYVLNDRGRLFALERSTGQERWRAELGGADIPRELPADRPPYAFDYQAPTPVLEGSTLYVAGADGTCWALNASDGSALWRFASGGKIRTSALVNADVVYFGSLDQFVYALDQKSGALKWKTDSGGPITTSPAWVAGRIVIGTRGAKLIALEPATGALAWERFQWFSWVESTPVVDDGIMYLGSSDLRKVRALHPDGMTRWSVDVNGWAWATPALGSHLVFVSVAGSPDNSLKRPPEGALVALDRGSGRTVWRLAANDRLGTHVSGFVGSPALRGDRVFVAGVDGRVLCLPTTANSGSRTKVN